MNLLPSDFTTVLDICINLLCISEKQYLTTKIFYESSLYKPKPIFNHRTARQKKKKKIRILTESLSPKKISLNDVLENNYVISQAKIKFMNW